MKQLLCLCLLIFISYLKQSSGYEVKDGPLYTKRPPWLRVCRRTDSELNKCLNDLFVDMFPQLAIGIPEINVDPFEPLPLDRVSITKGSGPITLAGSLYNLMIAGASNSTPVYTDFSYEHKTWNFGVDIPLLRIKSSYNLKGKILVLPLVGQGLCDMKLTNVKTRVSTIVDFPVREGREIINIKEMKVTFTVGSMKAKFGNLFNGNKVLGQTVNAFINQHALEIIAELQDTIGSSLAQIFTDIINNVYRKIPTDLWLLGQQQWDTYQNELKKKD